MKLHTFRGPDLGSVFQQAQDALGEDAMIVRNRVLREGPATTVEVVAVRAGDVDRFRRRLEPAPLPKGGARPLTIALVGPTGAGKTTTVAKLATNPIAFGGQRVGLLTLDTFRAGALEQLGTYAEIAGLPLEVVYDAREVQAALRRLASRAVILVDTPGRGPHTGNGAGWGELLSGIAPDETHLVIPASLRIDLADGVRQQIAAQGTPATHMLLSKLDEVPEERGVADLATRLDLPARWVTDGQDVPTDLRSAPARILASLGRPAEEGLRRVG